MLRLVIAGYVKKVNLKDSHGPSGGKTASRKKLKAQVAVRPQQQCKNDHFFLEASRLKMKDDYSAAFDLLQHCLTINPNASSALYEISQYYMYLKQVPQGQAALEKAVENDPDNYWYSQGLASLYQQQNEMQKARFWATRFSDRDACILLEIYTVWEEYDSRW